MNEIQRFSTWFNNYAKEALASNERRLVLLSGNEPWALSLLSAIDQIPLLLSKSASEKHSPNTYSASSLSCLIYSDSPIITGNVQPKRFRDFLGSESEFIIFSNSQFNADAFAALSGTLKAGGIFFLIMEDSPNNPENSIFLQRFNSLINDIPSHTVITEPFTLPQIKSGFKINEIPAIKSVLTEPIRENQEIKKESVFPLGCITAEQYNAVNAIDKVLSGHRKRPLVLTADRGRGKSSALAIACAQQLKKHTKINNKDFNVVITAPDIHSLSIFYRQLEHSLLDDKNGEVDNHVQRQGNRIIYGQGEVTFVAIDQLIKQPIKCNLLMIDEAAAIPVYLLEQLLCHYHRVVFSSTVHGYEGAGRGFTLKFKKTLDELCPNWVSLHINQPIRWREHDPLEQLVFDTCLLNAELTELTELTELSGAVLTSDSLLSKPDLSNVFFQVISAKELVASEYLLKQIFAILVTAHYQTKPSDLQLLLDNEQVQVACLFSDINQHNVIAVALLMNEGNSFGITSDDVIDVKQSKRRLRNHFLPQSLLTHCGFESAFNYQYLRIMRIAVHPQIHLRGVGSYFIDKIELLATKQGADFIGSSFGANSELLSFWLKAGFSITRIGFTKDKSSGEHSSLVLKGLNGKAFELQNTFTRHFYRAFDYLLIDEYNGLASELIYLILTKQDKASLLPLNELDQENVRAYSTGERLFSSCVYSLYLWFKHDLLLNKSSTPTIMEKVLTARLMQKHNVDTVCQQYGYTGKKQLNQAIKSYISLRLK